MSMTSFWRYHCWLWTYFTTCSSVSNVNFEQVNTSWVFFISLPFEFYQSAKFPKMRYHFCNSSGNVYFEITYSVFKKFRKTLKTNKKPLLVFNASSHWVFPAGYPVLDRFTNVSQESFLVVSNNFLIVSLNIYALYLSWKSAIVLVAKMSLKSLLHLCFTFKWYVSELSQPAFTCSKLTIETLE